MPIDLKSLLHTGGVGGYESAGSPFAGFNMSSMQDLAESKRRAALVEEATQKLIQDQLANSANTRDYHNSLAEMYKAQALNYGRDKSNVWQNAQADQLKKEQFSAILAGAIAAGPSGIDAIRQDPRIDSTLKSFLENEPDPEKRVDIARGYLGMAPTNKVAGSIIKGKGSDAARLGAAELGYHASKYRTDAMERIAAAKAAATKEQKPFNADQAFTALVQEDYSNGKFGTPGSAEATQRAREQLAAFKAQSTLAKSNTGITASIETGPNGKPKMNMVNKGQNAVRLPGGPQAGTKENPIKLD